MPPSSTLEHVRLRGAIRIGFQRHTPPFSYATKEHWPVGYSVALATDVVDALAARLNTPLRIQPVEVTSATRTRMLLNDSIDIECGSTTITAARRQKVAFSRPIFHTAHRVALKAGRSLSGGQALCITGITGSTSQLALLDAGTPGCAPEFVGRPSIGDAFGTFLENEQVDGIVADEVILASLMLRAPRNGVTLADVRLGGEHYGFMMRLGDLAFHEAVDRALAVVMRSDDFAQRYACWFERPLPGLGASLGLDFGRQLPHLVRPASGSGTK